MNVKELVARLQDGESTALVDQWKALNRGKILSITGQSFMNIRLTGIDLRCAVLHGTIFSGAGLSFANFSQADCTGVDFTGADFSKANLSEANFTGATLTGATFDQPLQMLETIVGLETTIGAPYALLAAVYAYRGTSPPRYQDGVRKACAWKLGGT